MNHEDYTWNGHQSAQHQPVVDQSNNQYHQQQHHQNYSQNNQYYDVHESISPPIQTQKKTLPRGFRVHVLTEEEKNTKYNYVMPSFPTRMPYSTPSIQEYYRKNPPQPAPPPRQRQKQQQMQMQHDFQSTSSYSNPHDYSNHHSTNSSSMPVRNSYSNHSNHQQAPPPPSHQQVYSNQVPMEPTYSNQGVEYMMQEEEPEEQENVYYDDQPEEIVEFTDDEPLPIQFPDNCKLFKCTRITNGGNRISFIVPVPSHATIADVEGILPEELRMDYAKYEIEPVEKGSVAYISKTNTIAFRLTPSPPPPPPIEEEPEESYPPPPILVNPKQFERILRRRENRRKLEESGRLPLERSKYLHLSRHLHAKKRKRQSDGRFETDYVPDDDDIIEMTEGRHSEAPPTPRIVHQYADIQPAPWANQVQNHAHNYHYHQAPPTSQYQEAPPPPTQYDPRGITMHAPVNVVYQPQQHQDHNNHHYY